ncbi:hypothetical protein [Undibacterium aquatile]|uniref:Uncharacterized protein n=1 Tax=Undibacterium aquatile TaxID=1537398 RepID=A0ABR6XF66_9BURK|nr:hypothetical protein [Undibacterium aquatile]MBC3811358.1 hypothetical protein [Undibacterium aquatile]
MKKFSITVRTPSGMFHYSAIAASSIDAHAAAIDQFGAVSVTVKPEVQHG